MSHLICRRHLRRSFVLPTRVTHRDGTPCDTRTLAYADNMHNPLFAKDMREWAAEQAAELDNEAHRVRAYRASLGA